MGRINLMDSTMDAVVKMVDGNPGAVTAVYANDSTSRP
jgi:hypothetical protein